MKKGASPLEKERQVLESLIDMRLLLLEASSLPLDEDRAFQDELTTFERDRLVELYTKRAIVDQVSISDEEMEEQFLATNRNRALRFRDLADQCRVILIGLMCTEHVVIGVNYRKVRHHIIGQPFFADLRAGRHTMGKVAAGQVTPQWP